MVVKNAKISKIWIHNPLPVFVSSFFLFFSSQFHLYQLLAILSLARSLSLSLYIYIYIYIYHLFPLVPHCSFIFSSAFFLVYSSYLSLALFLPPALFLLPLSYHPLLLSCLSLHLSYSSLHHSPSLFLLSLFFYPSFPYASFLLLHFFPLNLLSFFLSSFFLSFFFFIVYIIFLFFFLLSFSFLLLFPILYSSTSHSLLSSWFSFLVHSSPYLSLFCSFFVPFLLLPFFSLLSCSSLCLSFSFSLPLSFFLPSYTHTLSQPLSIFFFVSFSQSLPLSYSSLCFFLFRSLTYHTNLSPICI